ncbi:DivIVA domain-containing protein [Salinibacterium sp. ZJ70]|uniref:DivIVA domain-containing protein n=1 Tax=Salinibacterium sp. ZJ70 TaxID=2708084 RepID=UPI001421DEA6
MALTPEDVVNKRFNPTKFREGYDQDEVDDFLDEVVVELRRLNQENEELRQRLVAADARINELQRAAAQAPAAPVAAAAAAAPVAAPVAAPAPAPVPAPAAPEYGAQDSSSMDQSNTNNLLQLARRLHEEHVREGMEKRDQLIAEGHATAARLVSDAEQQQRTAIEALEQEKARLEQTVEELRVFESAYRDQLRNYIESQLRELEATAPVAGAEAPAVLGDTSYDSGASSYDASSYEAPSYDAPSAPAYEQAPAPSFDQSQGQSFEQPPTPSYEQAPAPSYEQSSVAPDYSNTNSFADLSQAAAPVPASGSTPPAYSGYPAPQYGGVEFPQQSQAPVTDASQQPEYPAFTQRPNNEYPGVGGN